MINGWLNGEIIVNDDLILFVKTWVETFVSYSLKNTFSSDKINYLKQEFVNIFKLDDVKSINIDSINQYVQFFMQKLNSYYELRKREETLINDSGLTQDSHHKGDNVNISFFIFPHFPQWKNLSTNGCLKVFVDKCGKVYKILILYSSYHCGKMSIFVELFTFFSTGIFLLLYNEIFTQKFFLC